MRSYTSIPVEHILIERIKQNKSLVDIKLTARACQEHTGTRRIHLSLSRAIPIISHSNWNKSGILQNSFKSNLVIFMPNFLPPYQTVGFLYNDHMKTTASLC